MNVLPCIAQSQQSFAVSKLIAACHGRWSGNGCDELLLSENVWSPQWHAVHPLDPHARHRLGIDVLFDLPICRPSAGGSVPVMHGFADRLLTCHFMP